MGSRYGSRVLRSTPSQKLIRAAAAWEWTLRGDVSFGSDARRGRRGEGMGTHRGSGASSAGIRTANNCPPYFS